MTKGTYNVGETVGPSKDGSFRSCLCAMLVFFAICVILILVAWPWKKNVQMQNPKDDTDIINDYSDEKYEKIIGEVDKTTTTTRKPRATKRPAIKKPKTTPPPQTTEAAKEPELDEYEDEDESREDLSDDFTEPSSASEEVTDKISTTEFISELLIVTGNLEDTTPTIQVSTMDNEEIIGIHWSSTEESSIEDSGEEEEYTTPTIQASTMDNEEITGTHWSSTVEGSGEEEEYTTPTSKISITNGEDTSTPWSTTEEITSNYSTEHSSTDYSTDFSTDYSTDHSSTDYSTDFSTDYSTDFSTDYSTDFSTDYSTDFSTDYSTDFSTDYSTESSTQYSMDSAVDNSAETSFNYFTESTAESSTDSTSEDPTSMESTTDPLIDIRFKEDRLLNNKETTTTTTTEKPEPKFETDGAGITNVMDYDEEEDDVVETKEKRKKNTEETTEVNEERSKKEETSKLLKLHLSNAYVCESTGCKLEAGHMLNKLNHSGDACEDFYDYTCGGDNSVDQDEDNWNRIAESLWQINSTSSAYLLKFRKYYDSCVTFHSDFNYEQRLKTAKDILHTVSRLYDRTQQLPDKLTLTELLTRLLLVDSAPLFDIAVDVDKQDKRFVFQMTPATHKSMLQDENFVTKAQKKCFQSIRKKFSNNVVDLKILYTRFLKCMSNYTDYLNNMERAVHGFGDFAHMEPYNITWHIQNLRTTIEWDVLPQIKIPVPGTSHEEAKAIQDLELPIPGLMRYDIVNKRYKIMKVAEMKLQFPLVDWNVLFSALVGKPVDDEQPVQVYFDSYFRNLFTHLKSMPNWQVQNALFAMFTHDLYNNLVVPTAFENRENFCLRQTSRLLPEVTSSMYMDTWPSKDVTLATTQANDMFKQLKTNLTDAIKTAEWLDDGARISLMMKVTGMQLISDSGATVWNNQELLNERLKDVRNDITMGYQEYAIDLLKRHRKFTYGLWNQAATDPKNLWWYYLTPYSTSPVSIYALNAVVFPIGLVLQRPRNIPRYIKLATVGYTLAKEIGRHFDTAGVLYSMTLSKDSTASYTAMEMCHLNKYAMSMSHQSKGKIYAYEVDPMLSLNEIIIENFAAKLVSDMSVDVMNDQLMPWIAGSFSREKIFYLAMAQEHCKRSSYEDFFIQLFEGDRLPPALLMKSFLGNLEMFASTFECPVGSGMNHPVKCQPFPELTKEADYTYLYGD